MANSPRPQVDLANLDTRTQAVEDILTADTVSFTNLQVSGTIVDANGTPYFQDQAFDGNVELNDLRVTNVLDANVIQADTIFSNNVRTEDGLSFLRLAFGNTGTGRVDPATISVRSEGFQNMVVDGDFVQVNGTMKGDGKYLTSFAERENKSLETRLSEYAKFSDRRVFVSATDGDDTNHGRSWDQAVRTIKRACEIAEPRTTIFVASGDYYEEVPIYVKPNVSIIGDSLRTVFLYTKSWEFRERDPRGRGERAVPINGINYNRLDYFHVSNAVYLYGLRFKHLQSPGYCVAFPCAIVDTGVVDGGLSNPLSPESDTLPVLYSPEGYYTDPRPQAGPFYEWERDSTGETDRFKNARITQVVVSNSGVGYSVDTRIDIDAPDVSQIEPNAGTRARARVRNVDTEGGIQEVEVTDVGRGYNDEAREQRKNVSVFDGSGFGSGALLSPVYTSESYVAWSEEGGTKRPAGRVFSATSSVEVTTSLVRGIAAYVEKRGSTFPKFARRNPGSYFDVADTIETRRAQYQDRVITFVSEAFPRLLTQEQQVLCKRDVGLIVDAVVDDLRRGGYDASLRAAQSYFVGGASVLSEGTVRPTVRAIETLADALKRTILNEIIETYPYQRNEGYTSKRRYRALTGDIKYDADRLYRDIRPNFSVSVLRDMNAYSNDANALQNQRETIVDAILEWASEREFTDWSLFIQERVRRDIGRWMDAIVVDLRNGGASASVRVALSYFFKGERTISDTLLSILSETLTQLKTRIGDLFVQSNDGVEKVTHLLEGIRHTLEEPLFYDPPQIVLQLGVPAFLARFPTEAQTHLGGFELEARYLEQQRETVQDEVVTFVQTLIDTSEGAFDLQPDQMRLCRRDTGLIVDSLVSDLRTGGCSRMVESANAYYVGRSTTRVFDDNQIDPTIAAIRFIRNWIATRSVFEQSEEAVRIAHLLLEGIALTLRVPTQTKRLQVRFATLETGEAVNTQLGGFTDEADTLLDERSRLQSEVLEWVDRFFPDLFVDASLRATCSRDVGLIVDALAHDLRFGGAKRIEEASIAYYRGRASVLPEAQRSPTIQAIGYLATRVFQRVAPNDPNVIDILSKLLLTLTNTIDTPEFTGGINPVFEVSVQNETRSFPQTASFFADPSRIEFLQDDVMNYVETEFSNALPTEALKQTCRRDVGLVLDAIARDLDEAGFVRCAFAASKYYEGMERQIPMNQLFPTISALEHLREKMKYELESAIDRGTSFEEGAKSRVSGLIQGIIDTLRAPRTMEQNDFPRPVRYVAYQLVDANLTKWRIEGSNNGNTWTVLDARDFTMSGANLPANRRFGIANAGRYTYYRLMMLQNQDNRASGEGFMHVTQIRFFELSPPQVYVDGPDIQNTKVRSIEVQSSGLGYSSSVNVSVEPFPGDDPPLVEAQVEPVWENGRLQRILVVDGGRGYQGRANVVVEDLAQSGSGAQAIAIMEDDYARVEADEFDPETGKITRVKILDRGSGYVNPPTVSITAPERLRPIVTASPYVQNCSNISGPWDTTGTRVFETHPLPFPLEDIYQDPSDRRSIDSNGSGGGIRIDGSSPRAGSPLRSFVVDAFTQVNQGGIGFLLTNLAYAQFVSTFGTFCSTHMRAIGGSFANCSNSVTDFGLRGLEAKGYWPEPFSRGRCIPPGNPDDPSVPTTWESGSGVFVPGAGYRSELVNVTIETSETFDTETDRLFVEIAPPFEDNDLNQTARTTGRNVFENGRRRAVELNNDLALSEDGELENLILNDQAYPVLGYGQETKRFRGVGYKAIPRVTLRKNDAFEGPLVELQTENVTLSNVSTIRVSILEGRRPDFLSIARIHGEWYTVQGVNSVSQIVEGGASRVLPGFFDVTFFPAPPYVDLDHPIDFHSVSYLSTGSHVMEYVGSGITYNALPENGGIPDSGTEIVQTAPAKVFFTTSDHLGNSKVGPLFEVNQATGQIALDATSFDLRNLAGIGPFVRNGVVVGQQIREVSNNPELRSSLGAPDIETVPTQNAVASYVQRRAVPTPTVNDNGKFLRADVSKRDEQGRSFAWQNLSINDAVSIDIQRVVLNTDVLTGLYIDGEARVYGDVLCDQMVITDPEKDVRMPFGSLVVHVEEGENSDSESESGPILIFRYRNKKGKFFRTSLSLEAES